MTVPSCSGWDLAGTEACRGMHERMLGGCGELAGPKAEAIKPSCRSKSVKDSSRDALRGICIGI